MYNLETLSYPYRVRIWIRGRNGREVMLVRPNEMHKRLHLGMQRNMRSWCNGFVSCTQQLKRGYIVLTFSYTVCI
jgi:hypothetical protein